MQTVKSIKRRSRGEDYVNNKEFSIAVVEYVKECNDRKEANLEVNTITNYIGTCFMKICNGLARSPNFTNYSYRDDMVMDAVENCIKAIMNYDINKPTRTGAPNAFSYFTQISYFAFLRRIAKEKKQADIKLALIENGSIGNFADFDEDGGRNAETMIEKIRQKNDNYYDRPKPEPKVKKVAAQKTSSKPHCTLGQITNFLA